MDAPNESQESIELPIQDFLDLHTFRPRDVKNLLTEYLPLCQQKNILKVRIIHGKGIGMLRQTVHALLPCLECVESFGPAHEQMGGWGATMVYLKPPQSPDNAPSTPGNSSAK